LHGDETTKYMDLSNYLIVLHTHI